MSNRFLEQILEMQGEATKDDEAIRSSAESFAYTAETLICNRYHKQKRLAPKKLIKEIIPTVRSNAPIEPLLTILDNYMDDLKGIHNEYYKLIGSKITDQRIQEETLYDNTSQYAVLFSFLGFQLFGQSYGTDLPFETIGGILVHHFYSQSRNGLQQATHQKMPIEEISRDELEQAYNDLTDLVQNRTNMFIGELATLGLNDNYTRKVLLSLAKD